MNYGKRGVRRKQQTLNAIGKKWTRKIAFTFVQVFLVAIIGVAIVGTSAGIGAFKGVLATAPDIGNIDVTPTGFSTFVYDIEGNQLQILGHHVNGDRDTVGIRGDQFLELIA